MGKLGNVKKTQRAKAPGRKQQPAQDKSATQVLDSSKFQTICLARNGAALLTMAIRLANIGIKHGTKL